MVMTIYSVPLVLVHCWLSDMEGIWLVKKTWLLVCQWWWFGWSFVCY